MKSSDVVGGIFKDRRHARAVERAACKPQAAFKLALSAWR
jgi:hypothetical protein